MSWRTLQALQCWLIVEQVDQNELRFFLARHVFRKPVRIADFHSCDQEDVATKNLLECQLMSSISLFYYKLTHTHNLYHWVDHILCYRSGSVRLWGGLQILWGQMSLGPEKQRLGSSYLHVPTLDPTWPNYVNLIKPPKLKVFKFCLWYPPVCLKELGWLWLRNWSAVCRNALPSLRFVFFKQLGTGNQGFSFAVHLVIFQFSIKPPCFFGPGHKRALVKVRLCQDRSVHGIWIAPVDTMRIINTIYTPGFTQCLIPEAGPNMLL